MQNIFIDILPPWVETGLQPAFYDLESGTVLQQTARMYAKVRELTEAFNTFSENVTNEVTTFEQNTNDEIERFEGVINDTVEEYIGKFNELHDYVHDYFDNLDVQEEINNKLDEMLEDGVLQEIITTYIQSNVTWVFDTVADMKLATNLINGSYARTLGFSTIGDGGGATYFISNTGTANEMDIIAVGNLYAILQDNAGAINIKQLGATGDGSTDDYAKFNRAFAISSKIILGANVYKINTPLSLSSLDNITIEGNGATLKFNGASDTSVGNSGYLHFEGSNNINIRNLNIDGNIAWVSRPYSWESGYSDYSDLRQKTYDGFRFYNCNNVVIENCSATKIKVGFHLSLCENCRIDNSTSSYTMADGVLLHSGCKNVYVTNHCVNYGNDDQFSMVHETNDNNPVEGCSFNNCHAYNSFGACAVQLECVNCSHTNCSSTNNKDVPIKMGTSLGTFAGKNNVMDNITVESSNTIYGNNTSLSIAETNGSMQMYGGTGSTVTTMTGCEIINSRFIETSGNNLSLFIAKQNGYKFKNCEFKGINIVGTSLTNLIFEDCTINSNDGNVMTNCSGVVFRNCSITYAQTYQARSKRALQYNNCSNVITDNCQLSGTTHNDGRALGYYADSTDYSGALTNINVPFSITNQSNVYSPCIITLDDISSYGYARFKAGQLLYFTSNNKLYLTTGTGWTNLNP